MTYIFCDIEGTYNSLKDDEKKEFIKLISKLDEKVYFSFISTANIDFVLNYVNDIKQYIKNTNIELLAQIANFEYINEQGEIKAVPCDVSKGMKMIYFQNSLEFAGNNIDNVIYIDDNANIFPLIYTMDMEFNKRLKDGSLNFTVIEKDNQSEKYCKDAIEIDQVKFISNNIVSFALEGLKQIK